MEPPLSDVTAPFWEATKEKRYLLQRCGHCGRAIAYPRESCPFCASRQLSWQPASGRGTVYSFTVEHRMPSPLEGAEGPYVVALVDLDEGARVMTNLVNCPPQACGAGMAVSVTWEPLSDGRNLPLFEPLAESRTT
jgi:hypothetical protein